MCPSSPSGPPPSHPIAPEPLAEPSRTPWRARLHQVVFEADTPAGRAFDVTLIALIVVSVVAVSLETVAGLPAGSYRALRALEWVLTAAFTVEYGLRLVAVRRPIAYATSFYGVVDLLAVLPTWVSLVVPGTQVLLVVRVLRLLRVFRVLKLARFLGEAHTLAGALRASRYKITVFLLAVGAIVVVVGSLMYVIEGAAHGFTSIPRSMYWTVVTLTTVGYGDIAPKTALGQALAALVMVLGYGIIAVPTGIVTAELTRAGVTPGGVSGQACPRCGFGGHDVDARYCKRCGETL